MALISAEHIGKDYRVGEVDVRALRDVSFEIEPASFVSFIGPSGSGKTTLLNLIGCLDTPTSGRLTVAGTDVGTLDRKAERRLPGRQHRLYLPGLQPPAGADGLRKHRVPAPHGPEGPAGRTAATG